MPLRLLSHLAPSVPVGLFEAIASYLEAQVGRRVELTFDTSCSGPRPGDEQSFRDGTVDLAFVCAASYVSLTTDPDPAVELLGTAWVPTDPRARGRPVYYGDVLAPAPAPRSVTALAGRRIAVNDDVSLSGHHCLRLAFADAGVDASSIEFVTSGSHLRSLELLRAGTVDAASIDSNVWRRQRRLVPTLATGLAPVAALGPHPAQPVVVRRGLPTSVRAAVRQALLAAHTSAPVATALADAELVRFAPVTPDDYVPLRDQMGAAVPPARDVTARPSTAAGDAGR